MTSPTTLCLQRYRRARTASRCSIDAACALRAENSTLLHWEKRSRTLSVIGAIKRAYSRPTYLV